MGLEGVIRKSEIRRTGDQILLRRSKKEGIIKLRRRDKKYGLLIDQAKTYYMEMRVKTNKQESGRK